MSDRSELERRIEVLERIVADQQQQLEQLHDNRPAPPASAARSPLVNRRAAIRTLGAAAAGAAAATVASSSPAAAANGDPILMGHTTSGSSPTIAAVSPIITTGFAFTDDPNYTPELPALDTAPPVVSAVGSAANRTALYAIGTSYGVSASGSLASLHLGSGGGDDPPTRDTRQHFVGEFIVTNGYLYFCIETGTPGTWRTITGPGLSNFVPTSPNRLYDSRQTDGRLSGGQTRVVSFGPSIDPIQAYLINLTITDTTGAGYLTVYANDLNGVPNASSINWFTSGEIVANTTVTQTDAEGRIKVTAGGTGSTQFVIDQVGLFV